MIGCECERGAGLEPAEIGTIYDIYCSCGFACQKGDERTQETPESFEKCFITVSLSWVCPLLLNS